MRQAARIDDNQAEIVKALRMVGASVQTLGQVGEGCPDILIGFMGKNLLAEIKDPSKPPSKRKLNARQEKWHREWNGQVTVIETVQDAFRLLGLI